MLRHVRHCATACFALADGARMHDRTDALLRQARHCQDPHEPRRPRRSPAGPASFMRAASFMCAAVRMCAASCLVCTCCARTLRAVLAHALHRTALTSDDDG
eukprot:1276501-Rhodomonas_salina.3